VGEEGAQRANQWLSRLCALCSGGGQGPRGAQQFCVLSSVLWGVWVLWILWLTPPHDDNDPPLVKWKGTFSFGGDLNHTTHALCAWNLDTTNSWVHAGAHDASINVRALWNNKHTPTQHPAHRFRVA